MASKNKPVKSLAKPLAKPVKNDKFAKSKTSLAEIPLTESGQLSPEVRSALKAAAEKQVAPKAPKAIEPISAPQALVQAEPETPKVETPKAVPDGYGFYSALDAVTGILFTTMQALTRAYVSALVCDSPAGVIVARWSSNHKALLRTAKAIEAGKGTAGLSNPRVVSVSFSAVAPENALATSRRREDAYYGLMGLVGPNHAARQAAKLAREAAQAAKVATQAASAPQTDGASSNA